MKKMSRKSLMMRLLLPIIVIGVWVGLSGVGGPYFGRIDEVSSNDMSTFLPSSAESTRVNNELKKFRDNDTLPAIVVFESSTKLTKKQDKQLEKVVDKLQETGLMKRSISPAITSDDKKAAFIVLPLSADAEFKEIIPKLQTTVADAKPDMTYSFTGPAVFTQDLTKAFAGIDGVLLLVALSVVFVILLVVYRSPILPIVTLLGAIFALSTAILVVWYLAKAGIVQLNGQVQGILFILVIGAATDYALLYIARYREELTNHTDKLVATKVAWKNSWEPIVAAGGTVTLGLLCLLVSDLGSNKALGPVGGIGVVFAIFSALTFLPATLLLLGKNAFWPRLPKKSKTTNYQSAHPAWTKVGNLVSRHPRRIWVGCTTLLIVACFFMPQLNADGVAQSEFVLGKSEARDGQKVLDKHFPAGSGSPVYVLVKQNDQAAIVKLLDKDVGIDGVNVTTTDDDKPTAPVGAAADELIKTIKDEIRTKRAKKIKDARVKLEKDMNGAPDFVIDSVYEKIIDKIPSVDEIFKDAYPFADLEPKVIDGNVLLEATLKDSADSIEARQTIERLRDVLHASSSSVQIGGISAVQLDTNNASEHDLRVIIPLILGVITIVLMLLLRSIIAPLVLLFTTLLSFGATLGVAALLFNDVWHYAGADPSVVIYGFVFLVALGIDYNIFLMTRVREEAIKTSMRNGIIKALVVTGGVISSAGIVLASTFAALYVIPILFLAQVAFIVAFGVLLDTLIVRSLIVPSLSLEIGRFIWWPSKISRTKK